MDSTSHTLTVWQSGRLAPQLAARRFPFQFGREQWIVGVTLVLSVIVMAVFVAVLEHDVDRGALQHEAQRSRAVA